MSSTCLPAGLRRRPERSRTRSRAIGGTRRTARSSSARSIVMAVMPWAPPGGRGRASPTGAGAMAAPTARSFTRSIMVGRAACRRAGARCAASADARLGNGAFLALRLVDLLGPGRGPAHADVFRYQHAATERVCRELPADRPETSHLTGLVRAVADAFQEQDARIAVPALLAYAHYLEDELRLEEALDVLDSLLGSVDERLAPSDVIAAQLRIGRGDRDVNRIY